MQKHPDKKNPFLTVLDTVKAYWPLLVVLFGIITTIVTIPSRLVAVEKKVETKAAQEDVNKLTEQTTAIYKWVEQAEKDNELQKQAPPGWKWDEVAGEYVSYKDDPRLKKK